MHQPWALFNANISPYNHTLAYAENLMGGAVMSAPIVWLTGNLVLASNAAALASCVLCALGAYMLVGAPARPGCGRLARRGAHLRIFAAPILPSRAAHLTAVQWLPFCLASMHAYFDSGDRRDPRWACAFFTLQVYTSGHGAVFTTVCLVLLAGWRVALGDPIAPLMRLRDLGVSGTLILVLALLMFIPYRAVQSEMGLRRSTSEAMIFAPNVESFLASPSHVDQLLTPFLTNRRVLDEAKALLFPGYLPLALAAIGVWSIGWPLRRSGVGTTTAWTRVGWLIEVSFTAVLVLAIVVTLNGRYACVVGRRSSFRLAIRGGSGWSAPRSPRFASR